MLDMPSPSEVEASGEGSGYTGVPLGALASERPDGFYWVVMHPCKWIIAEYVDGCWYIPGDECWYRDHNLMAIDECQVTRATTH